jgi:hypothetical protein
MSNNASSMLLSPTFQDAYWSNIDPDIRAFLDDFESREEWTYSFDELPDMFIEISKALPKFTEYKINEENTEIIQPMLKELIVILSSMPMRQAVSAVAWLDQNIENETEIGWAVAIYMEAAQIALNNENDPNYAECKLFHDRINLMLHSRLSTLLFVQLQALGDKND